MWSWIRKNSHMALSYWLAGAGRTTSVVLPEEPIISRDIGALTVKWEQRKRERERERDEQSTCHVKLVLVEPTFFTIFTKMPPNTATWVLKTALKSSLNTFFKSLKVRTGECFLNILTRVSLSNTKLKREAHCLSI